MSTSLLLTDDEDSPLVEVTQLQKHISFHFLIVVNPTLGHRLQEGFLRVCHCIGIVLSLMYFEYVGFYA